tara:strand:+ start:299 stop:580 length:282 start_codon:yes stop_codon:yes gene_type:complete
MKKIFLTLSLCLGIVAFTSSTSATTQNLQSATTIVATVVTDIPGQPAGYEAYFSSKSCAQNFIAFFGGGTISGTACKPSGQVLTCMGDPLTPC